MEVIVESDGCFKSFPHDTHSLAFLHIANSIQWDFNYTLKEMFGDLGLNATRDRGMMEGIDFAYGNV